MTDSGTRQDGNLWKHCSNLCNSYGIAGSGVVAIGNNSKQPKHGTDLLCPYMTGELCPYVKCVLESLTSRQTHIRSWAGCGMSAPEVPAHSYDGVKLAIT